MDAELGVAVAAGVALGDLAGQQALFGLLDAIVDRLADKLEEVSAELEHISQQVFEREPRVGGLARTLEHRGQRFDLERFRETVRLSKEATLLWQQVLKTSPAYFDPAGATVEQHEATSKDGTKIPYFIVKPKGMTLDGTTATLLTGYGGFQVPRLPGYLGSTGKLWVEKGGAYVLANIRGGGEFGPMWHQTAIRENKQRTWDDFIAVGEDLVKRGFTKPEHLGIQGGSQGGLLVGTAFTQRPDLFGAAIVQIPLFDMLRYHLIGRGASWIGEYGDPRIPEQRAWIEGYSPYQKIVAGVNYPAPFLWASTADDRTHPAHARKGAAKLKALGQPYYYFEDTTGGHSGGVDNDQRAKLQALQFIYLMQRLMGPAQGE